MADSRQPLGVRKAAKAGMLAASLHKKPWSSVMNIAVHLLSAFRNKGNIILRWYYHKLRAQTTCSPCAK